MQIKANGILKSIIFSGLVFLTSSVFALEDDRNKPLNFIADKMVWDQKTQKMRYSGNVDIIQGQMLLKAQTVFITKSKTQKSAVSQFLAQSGQKQVSFRDLPKIGDDEIKAWADEMLYDVKLRKLSLVGNAKILRGKDEIKAPFLFYYLDTKNIEARNANSAIATSSDNSDTKARINIKISPETLNSTAKKIDKSSHNLADTEPKNAQKTNEAQALSQQNQTHKQDANKNKNKNKKNSEE